MKTAILIYLATVNAVTFCMYGIDKWRAGHGRWRISEAALLWAAILGGSLGAWIGMIVFHHKTLHRTFRYGIPFILLVQIAIAVWIVWGNMNALWSI